MHEDKVKPRFWIVISLILLIICTASQILAVLSPNWLEVECTNGTLVLGLWEYCGLPVEALASNETQFDTTILDLFGYKQKSEPCISVGNYFIVNNGKTVWFYANRSLQCVGLAASVLMTILFSMYSFAPRAFIIDHTRGFAFLAFTLASFITVGLFIIAGNTDNAQTIIPEKYNCSYDETTVAECVILAGLAATSSCTIAVILLVICLLERSKRGDGSLYNGNTRTRTKTNMVLPSIDLNLANRSEFPPKTPSSKRYNRLMATCSYNPMFVNFKEPEPSSSATNESDTGNNGEVTEISTGNKQNNNNDTVVTSEEMEGNSTTQL